MLYFSIQVFTSVKPSIPLWRNNTVKLLCLGILLLIYFYYLSWFADAKAEDEVDIH